MGRWRTFGVAVAIGVAASLIVAALARFLAPNLTYDVIDRAHEWLSGHRGRTYRIALGAKAGSYAHLGALLDARLKLKSGYELELVYTGGVPENVAAILDPARQIHLAMVDSASDEAASARGLFALAAFETPYFFVIVPNDSKVRDLRDLSGPVDPGVRAEGQGPTLGEKVLDYYGLIAPLSPSSSPRAGSAPVSIVRPGLGSMVQKLDSGEAAAITRTQFLSAGLVDNVLDTGRFRLVPIPDHEALARAIPGAVPGFIPAGAYGPGRRVPPVPVPTLALTSMLVARGDLPGRVVRDILEAIYDPKFGRDIQRELTEESGRKVGALTLHPAAAIYYHRNDLVTSDRMGRLSFVASGVAGIIGTTQFVLLIRRNERRKARRGLLLADLETLRIVRLAIDDATDETQAAALIAQADDLLCRAEQDAAADRLDHDGIETLRSVHGICWRALQSRRRKG